MNLSAIKQLLESNRVSLHPGLLSDEISQIESIYQFRFPPDLREFLSHMLPTGNGFPRWRDVSERGITHIRDYLHKPLEGILFDIEHNVFWYAAWGERPADTQTAQNIARQQYAQLPPLIPIYGHRYMPTEPYETGNPVLSVYQTDVIPYGTNLEEYFQIEYKQKPHSDMDYTAVKPIPFWLELDQYR